MGANAPYGVATLDRKGMVGKVNIGQHLSIATC